MKNYLFILLAVVGLLASCRKIEVDGPAHPPPPPDEFGVLEGKISSDVTLKSGRTYKLKGIVYVTEGAVITIEPGARIEGARDAMTRGTLVITRGAKIMAEGTKEKPIIFTSEQSVPASGDWGGLVILGNAPVNASYNGKQGEGAVEGGVNNAEGLGLYGGDDENANSGILKYVRVEYAGYAYLPDNELNGITLAGVGKGTTVEYVQVYHSNDDGIECFGGNVVLKHILINSTLDDDFDTDNGWSGKAQFVIIMRDSSKADISKSESLESDNDANGSTLTPQTSGVFSNLTVIGPRATLQNRGNTLYKAAVQIRRNSSVSIFNSVFMGYGTGLLIDASKGTPTDLNIQSGKLAFQNSVIAGAQVAVDYAASTSSPTGWDSNTAQAWFFEAVHANQVFTTNDELKLKDPFNYKSPDFSPLAGSPLLAGADFNSGKLSGLRAVSFKGAVGPSGTPDGDWWKGWTILKM